MGEAGARPAEGLTGKPSQEAGGLREGPEGREGFPGSGTGDGIGWQTKEGKRPLSGSREQPGGDLIQVTKGESKCSVGPRGRNSWK